MSRQSILCLFAACALSACSSSGDLEDVDMGSTNAGTTVQNNGGGNNGGGNNGGNNGGGNNGTANNGANNGQTTATNNGNTNANNGTTSGSPDMGSSDMGSSEDTGSGADMGPCPDQYEPNNTAAEGYAVSSGETINAVNCGFDDDDVYTIDLTAGDTITLTHSFSNAGGNLDMNLHAPSQMADVSKTGSYAAITFGFEDEEMITHTAEETGTYYILSFNNNDTENAYTLAIEVN